MIELIDGKERVSKRRKYTSSLEVLYQKKLKYMDVADLRMEGLTFQQIADRKGWTRQNVQIILAKYFYDLQFPKDLRPKYIEFTCRQCGKKKMIKNLSYGGYVKKFCDRVCFSRSCITLPVPKKEMTKAQFRVYNAKICNQRYHRMKNDPVFKAKIKEYNRRASLKRKKL